LAERNRIVIVVAAALLLVIAFWFLLLSPKRAEVAAADEQIEMLHASIADAEQRAAIGEEARSHFASDYAQVVTLGKAVPDGDEQGALMVQLNQLGLRNDAAFTSISMEGSGAPVAEATGDEGEAVIEPSATEPPSEEDAASPTDPEATATAVEGNATTSTEPTEENVASLPLGATVGSAELATIPYQLEFSGDFFKLADFIGGIDRLSLIHI